MSFSSAIVWQFPKGWWTLKLLSKLSNQKENCRIHKLNIELHCNNKERGLLYTLKTHEKHIPPYQLVAAIECLKPAKINPIKVFLK